MSDSIKATAVLNLESLDLGLFLHGDNFTRLEFANSLTTALQTAGIAKLAIDTTVGLETVELFEMMKMFFALDMASKMVAAHPPQASPHRGYSYVGQEKLAGVTGFTEDFGGNTEMQDLKESFDLGLPGDSMFPNRWPCEDHIPHFRKVVERHYDVLERIQLQVLEALSLGLNLERDFFGPLHGKSHHEMRLLHYPPTKASDLAGSKTRIAEHTDFGSITLLFQDEVGGLEGRQCGTGEYQAIMSQPTECLVIVGDCFQRWTGNYIRAIPHRVTVPYETNIEDHEHQIPERFSIAFFGKPDRDAMVGNLVHPQFQSVQYHSLTAGEYNNMKLEKTY